MLFIGSMLLIFLDGRFGFCRFNVESLRRADVGFELNGFLERLLPVELSGTVAKSLRLRQSPPAHRAAWINTHALLKCFRRLIIPEVVHQIKSLVKPRLGLGTCSNRDVRIAYPCHANGNRKLLRRKHRLHISHVVSAHILLGVQGVYSSQYEAEDGDPSQAVLMRNEVPASWMPIN